MRDYRITLEARNEGLEYRDPEGVYRFSVLRSGATWSLYLPGSKGENYERHELSPSEEARILPRVTQYLERVKWFGLFGGPYQVTVVRKDRAN